MRPQHPEPGSEPGRGPLRDWPGPGPGAPLRRPCPRLRVAPSLCCSTTGNLDTSSYRARCIIGIHQ